VKPISYHVSSSWRFQSIVGFQ